MDSAGDDEGEENDDDDAAALSVDNGGSIVSESSTETPVVIENEKGETLTTNGAIKEHNKRTLIDGDIAIEAEGNENICPEKHARKE